MNRTPFYIHLITALLITPYVILVFYFSFNYNPLLFSNENLKDELGFTSSNNTLDIIQLSNTDLKDDDLAIITNNKTSSERIHTYIKPDWSLALPQNNLTSWTIDNDQILITDEQSVKAFDLEKNLLWEFQFKNDESKDIFLSPLSMNSNFIYASTQLGRVYKINRANGNIIWRLNLHGSISSPVNYHGGFIYISQNLNDKSKVHKVDAKTGELIWKSEKLALFSLPQTYVHHNYDLFYGISDDSIIALDTNDGKVKWESSTQGQLVTPPAVTRDRIYMANKEGLSLAISSKTGREIWNYPLDAGVVNPISLAGSLNQLNLITEDNYSHVINTSTGKRSWKFKFKDTAEKAGFGISKVKVKTAAVWGLGLASQQFVLWAPCQPDRLCLQRVSNGQSLAHIDIKGEIISSPIFAGSTLFLVHKGGPQGEQVLTKFAFGRNTINRAE